LVDRKKNPKIGIDLIVDKNDKSISRFVEGEIVFGLKFIDLMFNLNLESKAVLMRANLIPGLTLSVNWRLF